MVKNKIKKRLLLILCGFGVITFGIVLILLVICSNYQYKIEEINKINNFFEIEKPRDQEILEEQVIETKNNEISDNEYKYVAVLEIPKINLQKGLSKIGDVNNNVNVNVEILENSIMPNNENSTMILAGHSGIGRTANFKNLYKLNVGDVVNFYFNKTKYIYKLKDIYTVEKRDSMFLNVRSNKTKLIMITCHTDSNKQIVLISELIEKQNY